MAAICMVICQLVGGVYALKRMNISFVNTGNKSSNLLWFFRAYFLPALKKDSP